ncbi:hypothetical protein DS742_14040 [Lacrimispora amygdalina]|uniref:GIY-YIG domain-containing protein n=1 Tax=Lacrimispora amygdalina TaxID=253257 RepID=A0A3E2NBB0_9FIRM|nr:NUMOD1 domain-containing DNA-binding protein [Clostridium indicum]RFZ78234.1 hypothetical protein DS742_14040 [Clostridium indicum]
MKNYKIYKHTNTINGKVYVGQTYTSLRARFGKNGVGYRGCKLFYKAIQKYGWDNFSHEILEDNIHTQEIANDREKFYIKQYKSTNSEFGYNLTNGGNEHNCLGKTVFQYSMDGVYIREFNSISDANREFNICEGKISECCNGSRKSAGDYRWSFDKKNNIGKYIELTNSRIVYKYSLSGDFVEKCGTVPDVVKQMGIANGGHISNCCNGTREVAYGFQWKYYKCDNIGRVNFNKCNERIMQLTLYGKIVTDYDSITDACFQFDNNIEKSYSNIHNCLSSNAKSAYGYIWIYESDYDKFSLSDYERNKSQKKSIKQIDSNGKIINIFKSVSDAGEYITGKRCSGNISRSLKNRANKAYGYYWEYV